MTVSSSSTAELTVGRIVLHAYRLAGLMAIEQEPSGVQWQKRVVHGMELLEMIVKGLETEGRLVRSRRFYEVTLVSGQADYVLPETIMDVYGDAMFLSPGTTTQNASMETVIRQEDQDTWQRLGSRDSTGVPTLYFARRQSSQITVTLWLKPGTTEAGGIARLQAYYLLANSTSSTDTPDLERYWAEYLVNAVAARLAESGGMPNDKVSRLEQKAAGLLQRCKAYSRQRTNNQVMVVHGYGGSRR